MTIEVCISSNFCKVHHEWLQYVPVFLLIISVLSLVVAGRALRHARTLAQQKSTLDLVEKRESTAHYCEISALFSRLRRNGGFCHLSHPQTEDMWQERRDVLDFLNHYELVALAIRNRVLDGTFYRQWMAGPLVRDWNDARQFIQAERWKFDSSDGWTYRGSVYENLQWLALRWSDDAKSLSSDNGGHPLNDLGPSNELLPAIDLTTERTPLLT